MRPVYGRKCRNCGRRIPKDSRRGTRFCNAACRSEHWRRQHLAGEGGEAATSVPTRSDTHYTVFRLKRSEAGLLADLELVGFEKANKREYAIEKVAIGRASEVPKPTEEFVALPVRDLTPYFADGRKAGEVPGYEIPDTPLHE